MLTLNVKAIIFDRDGVIIDTDSLVAESMYFGLREVGINASENDVPIMAGMSIDNLRDILLSKWNFDFDEFRKIQRKYFYDNLERAPYFPETVEYIKQLHSENRTIGLTTSASNEGTLLVLSNIGIRDMFRVIVSKEDCTKHKPDPEPYLITAKRLGILPQDCIVIEDSAVGVEAAKKAKMKCIAIPNRHTVSQDFTSADAVVNSIGEVKESICFE